MRKIFRVIKKVDELGRIQIPLEIREKVNFLEKDKIDVYIKNNMIILEKNHDENEIKGIIRRVDELGRIVLPIEVREKLNIEENNELEICLEGNTIILKKVD